MSQHVQCYIAPLQDIRFSLNVQSCTKQLEEIDGAKSFLVEDVTRTVLLNAWRFSGDVLAPLFGRGVIRSSPDCEISDPGRFKEAYRLLLDEGWASIATSQEHGGQGLPTLLCAALQEIFFSAVFDLWNYVDTSMLSIDVISECASDTLKSLFIPKLISAEWSITLDFGAIKHSQPESYSAKAFPHEDGAYRLFGQGVFATDMKLGLAENDFFLIKAFVHESSSPVVEQALFLIPKFLIDRNGACGGLNAIDFSVKDSFGSVTFGQNANGATGWKLASVSDARNTLMRLKSEISLRSAIKGVSMGEREYQSLCYQLGLLSAAGRQILGRAVGGDAAHESLLETLVIYKSRIEALRAVAYAYASAIDLAVCHPVEMVRRENQRFVDLVSNVVDAWGQSVGFELPSGLRRLVTGSEQGATQNERGSQEAYPSIKQIVDRAAQALIEERLVPDGGKAFRSWLKGVYETIHLLEHTPFEGSDEIRERLLSATEILGTAVEWSLANFAASPQEVLCRSNGLLLLFAAALGGCEMAKEALIAAKLLSEAPENARFLETKIQRVRCFAVHELTKAIGLLAYGT